MALKDRVKHTGIRHEKLAQMLNVGKSQLTQWLNGSRPMPEDKEKHLKEILEKLEKAIG